MLKAIPVELRTANEFVALMHRHHDPVHRDKFRVAAINENGDIVGVAQVGRPVARGNDDGLTVEVVRLCTDGTKNACSFLYARAAKAADALGYRKIITYILDSEDGTSLKAALKQANKALAVHCLLHTLPQYIAKAQKWYVGTGTCPL